MRKILIIILILVFIAAIALSGYRYIKNSKQEKPAEPLIAEEPIEEPSEELIEEPVIEYNYLEIGEWGIASKYSSKSEKYEDVNVTVKQMTRGDVAEQIVKEYIQNNSHLVYQEPQEEMEWLVIEYQLNFGEFTKGNNGANSDIQIKIKGYGENENIIVDNRIYETVVQDISKREYTNDAQVIGVCATQIPVACEEYVIVFGNEEYNHCEFEGVKKINNIGDEGENIEENEE